MLDKILNTLLYHAIKVEHAWTIIFIGLLLAEMFSATSNKTNFDLQSAIYEINFGVTQS